MIDARWQSREVAYACRRPRAASALKEGVDARRVRTDRVRPGGVERDQQDRRTRVRVLPVPGAVFEQAADPEAMATISSVAVFGIILGL